MNMEQKPSFISIKRGHDNICSQEPQETQCISGCDWSCTGKGGRSRASPGPTGTGYCWETKFLPRAADLGWGQACWKAQGFCPQPFERHCHFHRWTMQIFTVRWQGGSFHIFYFVRWSKSSAWKLLWNSILFPQFPWKPEIILKQHKGRDHVTRGWAQSSTQAKTKQRKNHNKQKSFKPHTKIPQNNMQPFSWHTCENHWVLPSNEKVAKSNNLVRLTATRLIRAGVFF